MIGDPQKTYRSIDKGLVCENNQDMYIDNTHVM